ncbi:AMP-binding protein [Cesiribacter sp. SM1]|uniref:AMP-binding protein n=1 Tax=Cesiribacter sp. SM1 TaxID=2861196 RepID=UPI001CD52908|nr:AMP-binding protein [Cesiribacter sp. SM1]
MAFNLIIGNESFTPAQLQQQHVAEQEMWQPYQHAALTFVQQWLNNQQAFTVHTSGSTGKPKPIAVSRSRMQASARLTLQALQLTAGTPALLCINPAYIGGKMMLVRAMEGGLPIRLLSPEANPLKQLPVAEQPLFTALVPLQLEAILQDMPSLKILNQMKSAIIGGAAVSPALEEKTQLVHAPLYSTYGMTETVSHIALRQINGPGRKDYFTVLPGIQISTDGRGCLVINGPVVEEEVVTNDIVELLDENSFRWLGRIDNIVNTGGVKVQAEQLEAVAMVCLREQGHGRRVLAGGLPDEKLGQKVVLLLEGEPLMAESVAVLLQCLTASLPKYWAPKEILYVSNFVESDNGKIKRKETWARL